MNIGLVQKTLEKDGIIFLTYGGLISQSLISNMTEALSVEALDNNLKMNISNNILVVFIELSQNIMNYSKHLAKLESFKPEGLVVASKTDDKYFVESVNIVSAKDKVNISKTLSTIKLMTKSDIRSKYKELRRSGRGKHEKGGGIGFFEITKKCDFFEFDFQQINEDRYYFHIKTHFLNNKGNNNE